MRKIALVIAILALGCAAASAAPLADYDFGHAAFELGLTLPTTSGQPNPDPANGSYFGTTAGLEYGATVGLGAGMAVRVNHNEIYGPLGSGIKVGDVTTYYNSSQNNYDVMFGGQVPGQTAFGSIYFGLQSYTTGAIQRDGDGNKEIDGMQAYGFHGGIQGVHPLSAQHTVFYDVSYGTLDFDAKAGYSYSVTPNVDLNLILEYNNLRLNQLGYNSPGNPSINGDNTVQSWIPALSVTAKF